MAVNIAKRVLLWLGRGKWHFTGLWADSARLCSFFSCGQHHNIITYFVFPFIMSLRLAHRTKNVSQRRGHCWAYSFGIEIFYRICIHTFLALCSNNLHKNLSFNSTVFAPSFFLRLLSNNSLTESLWVVFSVQIIYLLFLSSSARKTQNNIMRRKKKCWRAEMWPEDVDVGMKMVFLLPRTETRRDMSTKSPTGKWKLFTLLWLFLPDLEHDLEIFANSLGSFAGVRQTWEVKNVIDGINVVAGSKLSAINIHSHSLPSASVLH